MRTALAYQPVPTVIRITSDLLLKLDPYRYGMKSLKARVSIHAVFDKEMKNFLSEPKTLASIKAHFDCSYDKAKMSLLRIGATCTKMHTRGNSSVWRLA